MRPQPRHPKTAILKRLFYVCSGWPISGLGPHAAPDDADDHETDEDQESEDDHEPAHAAGVADGGDDAELPLADRDTCLRVLAGDFPAFLPEGSAHAAEGLHGRDEELCVPVADAGLPAGLPADDDAHDDAACDASDKVSRQTSSSAVLGLKYQCMCVWGYSCHMYMCFLYMSL